MVIRIFTHSPSLIGVMSTLLDPALATMRASVLQKPSAMRIVRKESRSAFLASSTRMDRG